MLDRLRQALAGRETAAAVGLLLIDLDEFKKGTMTGHSAGDAVLRDVATRLVNCIRECDTACRYGGDEFVILLPEIRGIAEVEAVKLEDSGTSVEAASIGRPTHRRGREHWQRRVRPRGHELPRADCGRRCGHVPGETPAGGRTDEGCAERVIAI